MVYVSRFDDALMHVMDGNTSKRSKSITTSTALDDKRRDGAKTKLVREAPPNNDYALYETLDVPILGSFYKIGLTPLCYGVFNCGDVLRYIVLKGRCINWQDALNGCNATPLHILDSD